MYVCILSFCKVMPGDGSLNQKMWRWMTYIKSVVFDCNTSFLFKIICLFTIVMSLLRIVNTGSDLLSYGTFVCFVWFIVSQD